MILTAHQPTFLPWTGLLHKIALAEKFIVFDAVQFEYHEYGNRCRILTDQGVQFVTVPVKTQGHTSKRFCDMEIADPKWADKAVKTIRGSYAKTKFFKTYSPELFEIMRAHPADLATLNVELMAFLLKSFGIERPTARASSFDFAGYKSGLVLDMCKTLGAETYVFGANGKDYADRQSFVDANVKVKFQRFTPAWYSQGWGRHFTPGLSSLDLLLRYGPRSLEIVLQGNPTKVDELDD